MRKLPAADNPVLRREFNPLQCFCPRTEETHKIASTKICLAEKVCETGTALHGCRAEPADVDQWGDPTYACLGSASVITNVDRRSHAETERTEIMTDTRLTVRTANGTADDINVPYQEGWSVFDLKAYISQNHSLKPVSDTVLRWWLATIAYIRCMRRF